MLSTRGIAAEPWCAAAAAATVEAAAAEAAPAEAPMRSPFLSAASTDARLFDSSFVAEAGCVLIAGTVRTRQTAAAAAATETKAKQTANSREAAAETARPTAGRQGGRHTNEKAQHIPNDRCPLPSPCSLLSPPLRSLALSDALACCGFPFVCSSACAPEQP